MRSIDCCDAAYRTLFNLKINQVLETKIMFDQITEQFENSLKPVNTLFANNAKVLEQLAAQQTKLFTDVLNDSVAYTKTLAAQKDVAASLEVQKAFVASVQVKLESASKEAQSLFADAQAKSKTALEEIFAQAQATAKTATEAATKAAK